MIHWVKNLTEVNAIIFDLLSITRSLSRFIHAAQEVGEGWSSFDEALAGSEENWFLS